MISVEKSTTLKMTASYNNILDSLFCDLIKSHTELKLTTVKLKVFLSNNPKVRKQEESFIYNK